MFRDRFPENPGPRAQINPALNRRNAQKVPKLDYILTETVGMQAKRAVVMVARCNPPTIGHYKVINQMKKFIREHPEMTLEVMPIVVIVDGEKSGQDKARNPLSGEDRIKFMRASGNANGVKFLLAKTGYEAFEEVRKAGFEPIVIAAGSDRADDYKKLLDKYFKTKTGREIDHIKLKVDREEEADVTSTLNQIDQEVDATKVSGSLARSAVENGYEDVFAKLVGMEKNPDLARKMFNKIKKAMGT